MAFPKGNQFWKMRTTIRTPDLFKTPDHLWQAACEYFEYSESNPLEDMRMSSKGDIINVPKMRAMTIQGLCVFLGISSGTWYLYRTREAYRPTCDAIQDIMYQQKFAGAAAGLLNQAIIARELGLKDKKELSGPDNTPIQTVRLDPEQYMEIRRRMLEEDDV